MPLLLLWLGYEEREAAGTSLAAIVVIGALAAGAHALYGNIDVLKGVLIGLPAVGGTLAGVALQQRMPARAIAGIFSALLAVTAVLLVV